MTVRIGTSGGDKDVTRIHVGTSGGNKQVLRGYVGTPSGNKLFFNSFSVLATPGTVEGYGDGVHPPVTTNATTVVVTGGIGPFTYSWVRTSGAGVINSPSSASTTFTAGVPPIGIDSGSFQCTVTDQGTGESLPTNVVNATYNNG